LENKTNGPTTVDMQSVVLKKKIEAVKLLKEEKARLVKEKAAGLLAGLDSYNSDEDAEEGKEEDKVESTENAAEEVPPSSQPPSPSRDTSSSEKKRKRDGDDERYQHNNSTAGSSKSERQHRQTPTAITSRTSGYTSFKSGRNPYNNLGKIKKYGKRRPAGI